MIYDVIIQIDSIDYLKVYKTLS